MHINIINSKSVNEFLKKFSVDVNWHNPPGGGCSAKGDDCCLRLKNEHSIQLFLFN